MLEHTCELCGRDLETSANIGEFGTYYICQECLDEILDRQICRIIGHFWLPAHEMNGRSLETGKRFHYYYRDCGRCGVHQIAYDQAFKVLATNERRK